MCHRVAIPCINIALGGRGKTDGALPLKRPDKGVGEGELALDHGMARAGWHTGKTCLAKRADILRTRVRRHGGKRNIDNCRSNRQGRRALRLVPIAARMVADVDENRLTRASGRGSRVLELLNQLVDLLYELLGRMRLLAKAGMIDVVAGLGNLTAETLITRQPLSLCLHTAFHIE